jgi:hypothetical protein
MQQFRLCRNAQLSAITVANTWVSSRRRRLLVGFFAERLTIDSARPIHSTKVVPREDTGQSCESCGLCGAPLLNAAGWNSDPSALNTNLLRCWRRRSPESFTLLLNPARCTRAPTRRGPLAGRSQKKAYEGRREGPARAQGEMFSRRVAYRRRPPPTGPESRTSPRLRYVTPFPVATSARCRGNSNRSGRFHRPTLAFSSLFLTAPCGEADRISCLLPRIP